MAQTVPIDAYLGAARTGLAIGAMIYQLDGSTVHAAFSTSGWYEAPSVSGAWHHAGLSLPDAGGVVAVGVSGTEYMRVAVEAAKPLASDYTAVRAAKLDNLDATMTSRATAVTVTTAQAAIEAAIAALNNLSHAQAQTAATAALNAYDPPTKAELDSAVAPLATASALATVAGYIDTEVAQILAAVDTEIAAIKTKTDNLPAQPAAVGDIPGTAAIATAIYAVAVETGHDLTTVLRAIYAAIRGRSVADDADDPATITYYAPDNTTVRVTHTLTNTARTVT